MRIISHPLCEIVDFENNKRYFRVLINNKARWLEFRNIFHENDMNENITLCDLNDNSYMQEYCYCKTKQLERLKNEQ